MTTSSLSIIIFFVLTSLAKKSSKAMLDSISDVKEFKKVLRTRNNVLVLFINDENQSSYLLKLLEDILPKVKGLATVLTVNCYNKEAKKLCKKFKIPGGEPFRLKHYKDGEYHKDYDRSKKAKSIVAFLKDLGGEMPWEEEPLAQEVVHLSSPQQYTKLLITVKGPVLIMFYAPWCGPCNKMKPDYQDLAKEMKGKAVLAAMDGNKPENTPVFKEYNITGFPTLLYFHGGKFQFPYLGRTSKDDIKSFLRDPKSVTAKEEKENAWADEPSDVAHLTEDTFDKFLSSNPSVLVMFYAPWCSHCNTAKPHFVSASTKMVEQGMIDKLAMVDCTIHQQLRKRFNVNGFPSIKYFSNEEMAFDAADLREEDSILQFMAGPKEPPIKPPPEISWSEMKTDVVHLTDVDFQSFLRKKKHVLVMFYAPWCLHCKRAKLDYTLAVSEFADDPKVELAAVDCTKETIVCSDSDVSGIPTFQYFHYFNKEQRPYEGGRTHTDFVSFMQRVAHGKEEL